jgi:hypothetical protein
MADEVNGENAHPLSKAKRIPGDHTRSIPHKQPFVRAVLLSALHYMGIFTATTTLVVFFLNPTRLATFVFMASVAFIGITWFLAFFKRRSTCCPLCKGTPLINSGALSHQKATRIWPFNHGISATLSILATQTFRCMYCGTTFDLMKTPSHLAGNDADSRTDHTTYPPDEPS